MGTLGVSTLILRWSRDLEIGMFIYHGKKHIPLPKVVKLLAGWIEAAGGDHYATKLHIEVQVATWSGSFICRSQRQLNSVIRVFDALQCPKAKGKITGRFWTGDPEDLHGKVLDRVVARLNA